MKASGVCDPDMMLTKEQADDLDLLIRRLYEETPCICEKCDPKDGGLVMGIALLKNMYMPYNEHPSRIIRNFAEKLREQWKLGACANDILIVVATTDRLSYTDVGISTSAYVSLDEAYRIFLENKALFTAGRFYEGLKAMLENYHESTRSMKNAMLSAMKNEKDIDIGVISGIIAGVVVLIGVIILVGFVIYRYRKSSRDEEKPEDSNNKEGDSSNSWRRKDIKVILTSLIPGEKSKKQTKYAPVDTNTEKNDQDGVQEDDDEVIDTRLQVGAETDNINEETRLTEVSVDSSINEEENIKEMKVDAVVEHNPVPDVKYLESKRDYKGHVTNL